MKKRVWIVVISALVMLLPACGKDGAAGNMGTQAGTETQGNEAVEPPDLGQVRMICELATLECRFHNVAKSTKEAGTGMSHWGEMERTFWIEYTAVAKIGIKMEQVKMTVDGTEVTVSLPRAKVLTKDVSEISADSYIISKDSWFNKNPITAENQTEAVAKAQEDMVAQIENNSTLLLEAQDRAQKLIENYINKLGEAAGVTYTIKWEYIE